MRGMSRRPIWLAGQLAGSVAVLSALVFGLGGVRIARAEFNRQRGDSASRQLTVVAIRATPEGKSEGKTIDPKLDAIKTQLNRLMPRHGFKLLDVQSKQLTTGGSVRCDLRGGYSAQVSLVGVVDEDGKLPVRYEVFHDDERQVMRLVKSPLNQLFFCERELADGSKLLLAIGIR